MKKNISTIVAIGFISSMLATSAFAGGRHLEVLNPLWLPAAILSTVAATVATVATIAPRPVVFEHRGYYEPEQTVVYQEPRQIVRYEEPRYYRPYRHAQYYERRGASNYYYDRDRAYEGPRYREYR